MPFYAKKMGGCGLGSFPCGHIASFEAGKDDPYSGAATVVVTAATFDPFLGMVAGIVVRFLTGLIL